MEPFLLELGDKMDQTTKQIIQNLINKKLKYNRYKNLHFITFSLATIFSFIASYYMYKTAIEPYNYSVLDIISVISNNRYFIILITIGFILFGAVKIITEKRDKSEKEFHNLRNEIIDKVGDLLTGEIWKERHTVFEFLKKKYDINLYHNSK